MKNFIYTLVFLFSFSAFAQDFTGIWQEDGQAEEEHYLVVIYNETKGYIFTSFNFIENIIFEEKFLEQKDNYIVTKISNPETDWELYCKYALVDPYTIKAEYWNETYDDTAILHRKKTIKVDKEPWKVRPKNDL